MALLERDVLYVDNLTPDEIRLVLAMARKACVGGVSRVRAAVSRSKHISLDQLVGQLGECALSIYWTGSVVCYRQHREKCNKRPCDSDGGYDLPGANIDVKGSLMRYGPDPLYYHLPVRPKERLTDKIYVLALVPSFSCERRDPSPETGARDLVRAMETGAAIPVALVGWCTDSMLPPMARHGVFAGSHPLPARELYPLPPVHWTQPLALQPDNCEAL